MPRENDGLCTRNFKQAISEAIGNRMLPYVLSEAVEGEELQSNKAIMACLLDPRYTCRLYEAYGEARLKPVVQAIASQGGLLFANQQLVQTLMQASADQVVKRLRSSRVDPAAKPHVALQWWKELTLNDSDGIFAQWGEAAKMFLSMPAGGAPSEFQFSVTGRLVTKLRNRLGDHMLQMCLLITAFSRSKLYDFDEIMQLVQLQLEGDDEKEAQEGEQEGGGLSDEI